MATEVMQISVGPMQNFVYLVWDKETRNAVLIDSGWEIKPIIEAIKQKELRLVYVIATHEHFDHVSSIEEIARETGAKVVAHKKSGLKADLLVDDSSELELGNSRLIIIHTPGHTPGSICVYDGNNLFTGDTLFIGNCGRTDLIGGSDKELFNSLQRIKKLPDDTVIYPGHDYGSKPFRKLLEEKKENRALLAKTVDEFRYVE